MNYKIEQNPNYFNLNLHICINFLNNKSFSQQSTNVNNISDDTSYILNSYDNLTKIKPNILNEINKLDFNLTI